MSKYETLADILQRQGITRRAFLKFSSAMASLMALPPGMAPAIADALSKAKRPSVIWLSFQECTGCTESLTRSNKPTLESLILGVISLDYHYTLQAAAGIAAEAAREQAMEQFFGKYLLIVDGSIPLKRWFGEIQYGHQCSRPYRNIGRTFGYYANGYYANGYYANKCYAKIHCNRR